MLGWMFVGRAKAVCFWILCFNCVLAWFRLSLHSSERLSLLNVGFHQYLYSTLVFFSVGVVLWLNNGRREVVYASIPIFSSALLFLVNLVDLWDDSRRYWLKRFDVWDMEIGMNGRSLTDHHESVLKNELQPVGVTLLVRQVIVIADCRAEQAQTYCPRVKGSRNSALDNDSSFVPSYRFCMGCSMT